MKAAAVGEKGELLYTWQADNNNGVYPKLLVRSWTPSMTMPFPTALATSLPPVQRVILIEALARRLARLRPCRLHGAKAFVPDVDFILDIIQDMKCLQVKDGVIDTSC